MFHAIALFLALSVSPASKSVAAPACEVHANDVTGISVTVCAGSVVKACDAAGNCHGPVSAY